VYCAQNFRQNGVSHPGQQAGWQGADAVPAQALNQQDFQKPFQHHVAAGPVGGTLVHEQVDHAGEATSVTVSRTDMDHPRQQAEQERRVDRFDAEGTAEHLKIRFAVLVTMAHCAVRWFAVDTGDTWPVVSATTKAIA